MNAESLVLPQVRGARGYTPTPSLDQMSIKLGLPADQMLKLDSNENLLPPSPAVIAAIQNSAPNLYPDPDQNELRDALAGYMGVDRAHILCGNGGDELIHYLFQLFVSPGDGVIDAPPTFGVYAAEASLSAANYVTVPRRADFSVDVDAVEAAVRATPRAKLLFLTNPNNPTGTPLPHADILRMLALPVMVVVDEAYIELSAQPSVAPLVAQHDNLIVIRTLSKLAGLAGLRCGYGVYPRSIIQHMWKIKPYFSPGITAQRAGVAVLGDRAQLAANRAVIVAERARLCEMLDELGWAEPVPSEASFVLVKLRGAVGEQPIGKRAQQHLERQGILVRYFGGALSSYVRISIGQPMHTDRVIAGLRTFDPAAAQ